MKKKVFLLGATGSIGANTIDIIKHFGEEFELVGFSYHSDEDVSHKIQKDFPNALCFCTKRKAESHFSDVESLSEVDIKKECWFFQDCFEKTEPDIVLNGIAGARGLLSSYVACNMGLPLALANKESVVLAHHILKNECRKKGGAIIPVDSEHWAIFQLLNMRGRDEVSKIIITASGGPFRDLETEKLKGVRLEDAFNHPTWSMGKKITIDSSTLANKALEVIEATKLFSVSCKDIIVTIHKESIIHSMVQTEGGTIYAELSPPDMRTPILGALKFPSFMPRYLKPLDFSKTFCLSFSPPRYEAFPMLKMGFDVAEKGGAYPAAFNAANEVAVDAFMKNEIGFLQIAEVVEHTLQEDWQFEFESIESVFEADKLARKIAHEALRKKRS